MCSKSCQPYLFAFGINPDQKEIAFYMTIKESGIFAFEPIWIIHRRHASSHPELDSGHTLCKDGFQAIPDLSVTYPLVFQFSEPQAIM